MFKLHGNSIMVREQNKLGLCTFGLRCLMEHCSYFLHSEWFFFTVRKRSLGQGNIFSSLCQEFWPRGGGVCLSACWDTTHPPEQTPPLEETPPGPGTPPVQCMLGDTVNKRAVCILLECNLVFIFYYLFFSSSFFWFGEVGSVVQL